MKKAEKIIEMNEYKKGTNNKKERISMNKLTKTAEMVGKVFMAGAKTQLEDQGTWSTGSMVGLIQGLKYNGSVKRGVKAGVATVGMLSVVNGVKEVVNNFDQIKQNI